MSSLTDSLALTEDYQSAVLRLAWAVERKTRARILLCAGVELLPTEVPPPELGEERCEKLSKAYFLYARDVVVTAKRALQWFEDAARGHCVKPEDSGAVPDPSAPGSLRFQTAALSGEPPLPATVLPKVRVPFSADWHNPPRVRHLIPTESPAGMFTPEERARAIAWLETELRLDLSILPEFWGSVHLIAPNPIFRSLRVRRERDAQGAQTLVYTVVPRTGRSVAGLTLLVEEERPTGLGVLAAVVFEGPIARIPLPGTPGSVRERVIDPVRGALYDGPFAIFDYGFNMTVNLVSEVRKVAPTRPGDEGYEVGLAGPLRNESRIDNGAADPEVAGRILRVAEVDRARRNQGLQSQRWFRDQGTDAVRALRELIGPAKGAVFLCDPYFGGDDILRVVLAMSDPTVPVRILTGAHFLKFKHETAGTEGAYLTGRLAEVECKTPMNPVDIRVMCGQDPAIHDRFLSLRDRLWMLGSSINHFGGRGTLLVAVPDPNPVLDDLERVWKESPSLPDWFSRRSEGGT